MAGAEEKLAEIVRHVVAVFEPKIAVRLWNGEWLGPADGPVLALNDPAGFAVYAGVALATRLGTDKGWSRGR